MSIQPKAGPFTEKQTMTRTLPYDVAESLKTPEEVARQTGLSRESLYKALSGERSPSLDTMLKAIAALGLQLHATRSAAANA